MDSNEIPPTSKQVHKSISLQSGWCIRNQQVIRRIIPITKILHKMMFLRILMDIYNDLHEIRRLANRDSLKRSLKQRTGSFCGDIDGPRICVEEVREILGRILMTRQVPVGNSQIITYLFATFLTGLVAFQTCQILFFFYIDYRMKMVLQKAIRPCLCNGTEVLPPQVQKVGVITFLEENILMVIPAVINVIEVSGNEGRDTGGHDDVCYTDIDRPDRSSKDRS